MPFDYLQYLIFSCKFCVESKFYENKEKRKTNLSKIFHCFSVPHQPRLDWQMWFAALGSYQYNPWFISLIDKLLNNKKDVLALLAKNPFHERAPQFIKSTLYLYGYTKLPRNTSSLSDGIIKARLFLRQFCHFIISCHHTPIVD